MTVCHYVAGGLIILILWIPLRAGNAGSDEPPGPPKNVRNSGTKKKFSTETLRGRVVWLAEAMDRRLNVKSVPEAAHRVLALECEDGRLVPIVEDVRGRALRVDDRLRDIDVELFVRRYESLPMVQVIHLYSIEKDGKYELDYWCEVCSIALFELKPCDCCQGPIEFRKRKVKDSTKERSK